MRKKKFFGTLEKKEVIYLQSKHDYQCAHFNGRFHTANENEVTIWHKLMRKHVMINHVTTFISAYIKTAYILEEHFAQKQIKHRDNTTSYGKNILKVLKRND